MLCKFLHIVHVVLIKHFDQWASPMLLPMALVGDEFVAQAVYKYLCAEAGIVIEDNKNPQLYHSEVHRNQIDLQKCLAFLKKKISPIQANSKFINVIITLKYSLKNNNTKFQVKWTICSSLTFIYELRGPGTASTNSSYTFCTAERIYP